MIGSDVGGKSRTTISTAHKHQKNKEESILASLSHQFKLDEQRVQYYIICMKYYI